MNLEDVASRLLAAGFGGFEPTSRRQLRGEVTTVPMTGHETTAQALTFARSIQHDPFAVL